MAGESICIEVGTRAAAESLQAALHDFKPELTRAGDVWLVKVAPDEEMTPALLKLFHALCDWLVDTDRASLHINFGDRSFTMLRPSDARPHHAAEFLLERVIQLQAALESRVIIEQAKGVLAARLRVAIDEAFAVLRRASRSTGRQLHELAHEVVQAEEIPEPIQNVLRQHQSRRHKEPPADPADHDPDPT